MADIISEREIRFQQFREKIERIELYLTTQSHKPGITKMEQKKVRNHSKTHVIQDPSKLDITKYRLRWSDTTTNPKIPYSGIPFIIVGFTVRACQNGPTPKPKNPKASLSNSSYSRKRKNITDSKKKGCEACIRCRKILTFPEYKIDGQPTKHLKFKRMKALTNNFSNAEKKMELHAMFPSPIEHSNHPLGQLADFTQTPDEVVINKIHKLVQEGVRGIQNIKVILDTFVANYIQENFPDTKINKTNRRFYLTDRDIRNHMHIALSKVKKSELKKAVRCLQNQEGKTIVEIDDIVVTIDTDDYYAADAANSGEDVIVIVDSSAICHVDAANRVEDAMVATNSGTDGVMPVDTTEIRPMVAANPGGEGVVPVDTTEIRPMVSTNQGDII